MQSFAICMDGSQGGMELTGRREPTNKTRTACMPNPKVTSPIGPLVSSRFWSAGFRRASSAPVLFPSECKGTNLHGLCKKSLRHLVVKPRNAKVFVITGGTGVFKDELKIIWECTNRMSTHAVCHLFSSLPKGVRLPRISWSRNELEVHGLAGGSQSGKHQDFFIYTRHCCRVSPATAKAIPSPVLLKRNHTVSCVLGAE
jgi:hypothetical protein